MAHAWTVVGGCEVRAELLVDDGDSLPLQRILGHSTLTMTSHYAHLAQNHQAMVRRSTTPSTRCGLAVFVGFRRAVQGCSDSRLRCWKIATQVVRRREEEQMTRALPGEADCDALLLALYC